MVFWDEMGEEVIEKLEIKKLFELHFQPLLEISLQGGSIIGVPWGA